MENSVEFWHFSIIIMQIYCCNGKVFPGKRVKIVAIAPFHLFRIVRNSILLHLVQQKKKKSWMRSFTSVLQSMIHITIRWTLCCCVYFFPSQMKNKSCENSRFALVMKLVVILPLWLTYFTNYELICDRFYVDRALCHSIFIWTISTILNKMIKLSPTKSNPTHTHTYTHSNLTFSS